MFFGKKSVRAKYNFSNYGTYLLIQYFYNDFVFIMYFRHFMVINLAVNIEVEQKTSIKINLEAILSKHLFVIYYFRGEFLVIYKSSH